MEHFIPDRGLPGEWVSPSRRQTIQSRHCPLRHTPLTTSNRYSVLDPASIALQNTPERSPGTAHNQRINKLHARTHGEAQRQSLFEASIAASINPHMPIGSAMAIPSVAIQSLAIPSVAIPSVVNPSMAVDSPNLQPASPDIGPSLALSLPHLQPLQLGLEPLPVPPLPAHPFGVLPIAVPINWRARVSDVAMHLIGHLPLYPLQPVAAPSQHLEAVHAILEPPQDQPPAPSARLIAQR
jgi:hypothetical protein